MMVKTPEKKEERKQNAKRKYHSAPLMKSESSKRRNSQVKSRAPRAKFAESSNQLAKAEFGHEKNQSEEEEEQEEELETQIAGKRRSKNQSASMKKKTILDDEEEELEKKRSKSTNLDGKSRTQKAQIAGKRKPKNQSASVKKKTILDDEEEELEKKRPKRRNLDGKSSTPQAQIGEKSRIGYSIDGKKLPRYPQIEKIVEIIGDCSEPFEQKVLKTDVEKITISRDYVRNEILPLLTRDEDYGLHLGGEIPVNTYDEFGNYYEMNFESYNDYFYRLSNGWGKLFEDHKLNQNGDCYVVVWMFRHKRTDEVCFAVILKR